MNWNVFRTVTAGIDRRLRWSAILYWSYHVLRKSVSWFLQR